MLKHAKLKEGTHFSLKSSNESNHSIDGIHEEPNSNPNISITSKREEYPINEFTLNDQILCMAFPITFLTGEVYKHRSGNLNMNQTLHLLYQFTNIPAQDRDLIGFLFDIKQRHDTIYGVCNTLKKQRSSVKEFEEMRQDPKFKSKLIEGIKAPDTPSAHKIIATVMNVLNFAGKQTSYGAVESNSSVTKIREMSRKFGAPSIFITICPDDLNNPYAFRLSFKTINNECFPATLPKGNDVDALQAKLDYLKILKHDTQFDTSGTVYPCGLKSRAKMAMENPVAYVSQYKKVLVDILTVLIGIPPQNIQTKCQTSTLRKTYYMGDTTHKGIFGNILGYYGVNEDHQKGTLHCHIMCFGSISPYVLQTYAGIPNICSALSQALDSMYTAQVPRFYHAQKIISRVIPKLPSAIGKPDKSAPNNPFLLQNLTLLEQNIRENKKFTMDQVQQITDQQRSRQQYHEHTFTCHKGYNGKQGCRLAMPRSCHDDTLPVELSQNIYTDESGNIVKEIQANDIPLEDITLERILFPLQSETPKIIVWEIKRPKLKPLEELHNSTNQDMHNHRVQELLMFAKAYPEIQAWILLLQEDIIKDLYRAVNEELENANGWIAESNPILSLCIGSHNNTVFLGSQEQGRGAMFYISPYMLKSKTNIQQSLSVMLAALNHCDKYPSEADDAGSIHRTTKYIIQRILNQLNLKCEISDYQAVAALTGLPSEYTSCTFSYVTQKPYLAFIAEDQITYGRPDNLDNTNDIQNDTDNDSVISDTSLLDQETMELNMHHDLTKYLAEDFGSPQIFTILEDNIITKQPVPYPLHYRYRGEGLKSLSRFEYICNILFTAKKLKKNDDDPSSSCGRKRVKRFDFAYGHPLHGTYVQTVRSKQTVPITCGKCPRYPGSKPIEEKKLCH